MSNLDIGKKSRLPVMALVAVGLLVFWAIPRSYCVEPWTMQGNQDILGIHYWNDEAADELGYTNPSIDKKGWTVETLWLYALYLADGINAEHEGSASDSRLQAIRNERAFTPIIRISWHWNPDGDLPGSENWSTGVSRAVQVIRYLYNNYGVVWFQIGNEPNLHYSVSTYIDWFQDIWGSLGGMRTNVHLLTAPVAPWALSPDSLYYDEYLQDMVQQLGTYYCGGYAIHPYGNFDQPADSNLRVSYVKWMAMSAGWGTFSVMKTIIDVEDSTTKPILITETASNPNQGETPETHPPEYHYPLSGSWFDSALTLIDNHNNISQNKAIAMCWFVWNTWPTKNNPADPWYTFSLERGHADYYGGPEAHRLREAWLDYEMEIYYDSHKHNYLYRRPYNGSWRGNSAGDPWVVGTHGLYAMVEAEDYDIGRNLSPGSPAVDMDQSYYDTTGGNWGGAYRSDDVDLEQGGWYQYNVGWIDAAEYWKYTIECQEKVDWVYLLVSTPYSNKELGVYVDGSFHTSVTLPNTGGFHNWQWLYVSFFNDPIDPGIHTFHLQAWDDLMNIDTIAFGYDL